jgi:hypothetical protein
MTQSFYTNVQLIGNQFLVRGVENGKRFETRDEFFPTLFVKTKKDTGACFLLISQQNKGGYDKSSPESIKGSVDNLYKPDIIMIIKNESGEDNNNEAEQLFGDEGTVQTHLSLIIRKNRYGRQTPIEFKVEMQYSKVIFED